MNEQTTYIDAINQALREEMQKDESVFCLGEDIGIYGGAFKATKGLLEEFGRSRILDTPLSESAIVGSAIGAALMGMRPVAEMQFADFVSVAFNQLACNGSTIFYRYGTPVPMVVRCPCGGGIHGGPFHSQNVEAYFFHIPGIKMVIPATPYDAKGLLKASIRDNNIVLFMEHKFLYRRIKEVLPKDDYTVEIGKGLVRRDGEDATVITYGSMVHMALQSASYLAKEGYSIEVVDMRSLKPFDKELMLKSAKKTGKVLVLTEDQLTGSLTSEWASIVADEAFEYLDAPVKRLGALDTPVPYSPPLEDFYLPNQQKISAALKELLKY
ncbi:alpha-ketoacid dehydrogenase subunit beta [candidate division KSB1 bacterium]